MPKGIMMKFLNSYLLSLILTFSTILPQGSAGSEASIEYSNLIDMPTAGVLKKGNVGTSFYLMPEGVVIGKIEVGVFKGFSFGISYGAANFIGVGTPDWYKLPGVNVKIKLLEETETLPAFTLGFESQGKGKFYKRLSDYGLLKEGTEDIEVNRFKIKSPGFFIASSKNFQFIGFLTLHGCISYSLERDDHDKDLNLLVGAEKTLGSQLSLIAEFDFSMNDNGKYSFGDGQGYFNAGIRWSPGDGFTIGFDLRDLFSNKKLNPGAADRALKVEFIKPIF